MAYVVIATSFAVAGAVVARVKGNSVWLWFLICGLVPFLGLLAAVLYRSERNALRRQCPGCGKLVMLHDALCTSCGTELEFPDVAIAPESANVSAGR
jgi:predicted RNA-binding Zn-ribbon protein involved in translation (DUF1610 family)